MHSLETAQIKADVGEEIVNFADEALAMRGSPDEPNALECILVAAWQIVKDRMGADAYDEYARELRRFADRVEQLGGKPH